MNQAPGYDWKSVGVALLLVDDDNFVAPDLCGKVCHAFDVVRRISIAYESFAFCRHEEIFHVSVFLRCSAEDLNFG
jgi:hypothetical protein